MNSPSRLPLFPKLMPLCGLLSLLGPAVSLQAARTAYYQFESTANPGLDSAGGDDNATLDGGTHLTVGALAGTGAHLLDGKTPGFTIPAGNGTFSATENFTVSAWFRVAAASGRQRIFSSGPGWGLAVDFTSPGNPRILMTAYAIEDKFFDAPDIITGRWFQVTVVVLPANPEGVVYTRIFLNGELIGEDDGFYNSVVNNMLIGSAGNGFEGFNGALDELAYYDNALSDSEALALYKAGAVDSDGDTMLDTFETAYGLNPNSAADAIPTADKDLDGASNLYEYQHGLIPNNPDTDGDGLKDGVENGPGDFVDLNHTGTDPKNPDSDGDGIPDGTETATYHTDPTKTDTDGDLYPDYYEIFIAKSDPLDSSKPALTPNLVAEYRFELPGQPGFDSAGGDDSASVVGGGLVTSGALAGTGAYAMKGINTPGLKIGAGSTDPDPDFSAVENFSISAWFNTSVSSGRHRIMTCNAWGLGIDFNAPQPRVLMTTYTVEDKLFPAPEIVPGKWFHVAVVVTPPDATQTVYTKVYLNGVLIGQDDGPYNPSNDLYLGAGGDEAFNGVIDEVTFWDTALTEEKITSLYALGNSDDDHDGMPATWELNYGLNPNDPGDAVKDLDGDGLSNLAEYTAGLLPDNKDTDGDGLEDGWEDGGGNYVSATKTGTNPHLVDSDADGIPDGEEKAVSATDPYITDPTKADTDGDGLPDGYEVKTLFSDPTSAADPVRPPGLVAHYEFEDESNLGADSAGGDDKATPTGGVYQVTGVEAKVGNGALYLGGTDYLNIGAGDLLSDADFKANSGLSAAAWFSFSEATGRQRLISGAPGWGLAVNFLEGTPAGILLTAYGIKDAYFPTALTPGQWYHVAFSVSKVESGVTPEVIVYLNGTELGRDAFLFNPATNFSIGSASFGGAFEAFAGSLDDLRYYNKEVSASEVTALYAMGGTTPSDPGFQITSFSRSGGLVTVTFPSTTGSSYTLQRSATLLTWQAAGSITASGGSSSTLTESTPPPAPATRYFYRVLKNS